MRRQNTAAAGTTSANQRKIGGGANGSRRPATQLFNDDNSQSMIIEPFAINAKANDATIANLEQEVRSLKFDLQQQSDILQLKTETLKNVQE